MQNINDDKYNNQSSLFGNNENTKEEFEFLPSIAWKQKELLSEEFKSLGFYISNHPLNEYDKAFEQLKIISFNQFFNNDQNEGLVAGTIMSIQEKKSIRGTPYAIIKFSDKEGEFELFLFSEVLVDNRDKLVESESFVINLQKDISLNNDAKKRVNVRKIMSLEDVLNKPYSNVTIELKENYNLKEIKSILSKTGETKINIIIKDQNIKAKYLLQNNRKFDLKHLKALKAMNFVTKITV